MRILVVYRHYLPDTPPYAHMLGLILARLRADGHEITVLTGLPSYETEFANKRQPWRECRHGIRVRRVALLPELGRRMPLRALNSLLFAFRGALHALHARQAGRPYDLLWTSSTPPILQGAIIAVAARLSGHDTSITGRTSIPSSPTSRACSGRGCSTGYCGRSTATPCATPMPWWCSRPTWRASSPADRSRCRTCT
jgi:hypothetical protein